MLGMRRIAWSLAACLVLSGCAREGTPPARPNVLLILVDALRADHLGAYGYSRATSPNLDALAAEGVLFERAWSQAPWTKPSIPTLFTSLYPIQHGVYEGETPGSAGFLESDLLGEEFLTAAEAFRAAGFRTGAFVNNAHLLPAQGFAQGFDVYEAGSFDAAEIGRRFLAWLDGAPQQPFFAYLHLLDAHWPFQPAPAFVERFAPAGRYDGVFAQESWNGLRDRINDGRVRLDARDREELVARHDAAIAAVDDAIGRLLAALRERGALDATFVLLTADHGEELLDHGRVGHGGTLYEEVLHVPLILRPPGGAEGRRVGEPARVLDVFPTLAAAAGVPLPPGLEGRDLLAPGDGERELVAETRHQRSYALATRLGDWKYLRFYRAVGPRALVAPEAGSFGLAPGMRLKVKGSLAADGTLVAEKVSLKDPGDVDVELSGSVSARVGDALRIAGFEAIPERRIDPEKGGKLLETFAVGDWVKVEGKLEGPRRLVVDSIEALPESDRETVIEGIAETVAPVSDAQARLAIAGLEIRVSGETRIKGAEPVAGDASTSTPTAAPDVASDPFVPTRLLSREGLEVKEELYDLASDPRETRNLAADSVTERDRLRARLDAWLERMAARGAGRRAERAKLDAATVEELRGLGYVE